MLRVLLGDVSNDRKLPHFILVRLNASNDVDNQQTDANRELEQTKKERGADGSQSPDIASEHSSHTGDYSQHREDDPYDKYAGE